MKNKISIPIFLFSFFSFWLGGLLYFVSNYNEQDLSLNKFTDGIVVFTGSSGRINEGISLLEQDKSRLMLVTGVNQNSLKNTEEWIRSKTSKFLCCIELETRAKNTHGNAIETIKWIQKNNLGSIRLVTSSYHILRSEIELRKIAPKNLVIIKHPIKNLDSRVTILSSLKYFIFISIEYSKFIISLFQFKSGF